MLVTRCNVDDAEKLLVPETFVTRLLVPADMLFTESV